MAAASSMTFRERRERAATVKTEIRAARDRLGAALLSMDYTRALGCQIEVDHLQRQVCHLEHRHGHEPYSAPDEVGP
jgi:hypothetical protein